ncbi:MAG: DUF4198 domain-containing protein [Acidimicrobiia bacterium]|nr:DUF4198 domain-containing protein [Acidimicrobiia bacterium]
MRFLSFLFVLPVLAHTLYFLPAKFRLDRGEKLVFSVHEGDGFPDSESAAAPERLLEARLVKGEVTTPIADFLKLGQATHGVVKVEQAGTQWLAVRTRSNLVEMTPDAFERHLREEGLQHVIDWRRNNGESSRKGQETYTKYAKSLVTCEAEDEGWKQELGLALEFVPEVNPGRLTAEHKLPVRLLWRGKPAGGIRVEKAWTAGGKSDAEVAGWTDGEGRIDVAVDRAGRWRLHAVAMERAPAGSGADWESYWATLTFEVR